VVEAPPEPPPIVETMTPPAPLVVEMVTAPAPPPVVETVTPPAPRVVETVARPRVVETVAPPRVATIAPPVVATPAEPEYEDPFDALAPKVPAPFMTPPAPAVAAPPVAPPPVVVAPPPVAPPPVVVAPPPVAPPPVVVAPPPDAVVARPPAVVAAPPPAREPAPAAGAPPPPPLDDLFALGPDAFAGAQRVTPPPTILIPVPGEDGEGDWSLAPSDAPPAPLVPPARADEFDASYFDEPGSEDTPIAEAPGPLQLDLGVDPSDATPRTLEDTDTETVEAERAAASAASLAEEEFESGDGRAEEVESLMREMGECDDDFHYHDIARRAEILATALADEGRGDLAYRAMVLFARHAGDDGKRTPLQRDAAMDHLQRLASGMRLGELVDRACAPHTESSLEATQVLLRLGPAVVPMLFRAVEREADPNRRGQIHGILIAMGEAAMPELLRAFESREPVAVRAAARLAGELQSPKAVPPLALLLEGSDASLRQEAAKALVRIGDARALDVLVRALESPNSDVPNLAAFCLGASGNARAADALQSALRRAVGRRRYEFATELVRALGRLGRAEAASDLAALLAHRGLRYRSQWRDLKAAAAAALGRLPGDEARNALLEAAKRGDGPVRKAAQTALDRRGRG
jgi:HEAT repeat protein